MTVIEFLLAVLAIFLSFIGWVWFGKEESLKAKLKLFWSSGTYKPIQRIGLIVLIIGFVSFISWSVEDSIHIEYFFQDYDFPRRHEHWFYKLHVWFIPVGLLLTWLYPATESFKNWITANK